MTIREPWPTVRDDFTGFKEIKIIATVCNLCYVIAFSVKIYKCGDKLYEASYKTPLEVGQNRSSFSQWFFLYKCYSEKGDGWV